MPELDTAELPALERVMPHAGPMLLLARILHHDETETHCEVRLADQRLFRRGNGRIPCWVGIEYMAQCIAAHAGLLAWRAGEAPRIGYLLGSRRLTLHRESFPREGALEVRARHLRGRVGLSALSFACAVLDGSGVADRERYAEGQLSIALPRSSDAFEGGELK